MSEIEPRTPPALSNATSEPPEARAAAHEKLANGLAWEYDLSRAGYRAILKVINSVTAGLQGQLEEARRELQLVDDVLARRPALDDVPTRYAKIEKAITTAKRAESAEAANQKLRTALTKCCHKFREYEQLHLAKGVAEKAAANREMAEMADAALLGPAGGDSGS